MMLYPVLMMDYLRLGVNPPPYPLLRLDNVEVAAPSVRTSHADMAVRVSPPPF